MLKLLRISQRANAVTVGHNLPARIFKPTLGTIDRNRNLSNSQITPKNQNTSPGLISITKYFENRSIFITGATGFVGKVLVEKLLRSCTNVGDIYVLIRPSRGKCPKQRLQDLLSSSIFNVLRKEKAGLLEKVIPISGDITLPHLGISHEERLTLEKNVSVVFHSAASVYFNLPLITALESNLEAVRKVFELSKDMKKLSSFVYVSTAYCNAELHRSPIEEIVYPAPFHPDTSFQFFSRMDQLNILKPITTDLLGGKPNTYVFSKHLAEKWLEVEAQKWNLPACIVRPSIVGPIYNDPIELQGWTESLNGVGVFLNGVVHGLNYISYGDPKVKLDFIPVDFLVKVMIAAAWETGTRKTTNTKTLELQEQDERRVKIENCRVYNACINQFSSITHGHFSQLVLQEACRTPFSNLIRPPSVKLTMGGWWEILNFLKVGIPCIFMDFLALLCGQKQRMRKSFNFATSGMRVLAFFKSTEFTFVSNNVKNVRAKIPDAEKRLFDLNMEELNWPEYVRNSVLGFRRYFDNENDSTIPAASKRLKRLRQVYYAIDASIVCAFIGIFIFLCFGF